MNNFDDMTISEKLTCFVDGELAPEESGDLFFELAKNPDYQEELRQLVMMKNTFKNSMVTAPLALKQNVLKKTVYRDSPYVKIANAVALLIAFILSKNSLTYAGIGLLALTAVFLVSDVENTNSINVPIQSINKIEKNIPKVSSREVINQSLSSNLNDDSKLVNNNIVRTNIASKPITKKHNIFSDQNHISNDNDNLSLNGTSKRNIDNITLSEYESSDYFSSNFPSEKYSNIFYNNNFTRFLNKLSFSIKKFDGNSTPNFNLKNTSESILNNMSIGLNYNIDYNQSISLIVGFENYLMDFEKYDGDILYNYRQSYNTQWLGLQYSYSMDQMGESGIRPNLNILAGATNIGPILKLGAGITYYISDSFSVTAGIESGWLFYSNNGGLDNSKWFNTHKLGYNIGFNLGL